MRGVWSRTRKSLAPGNAPETVRFPGRRATFAKNREEPRLPYLDQKRAPNPRKLRIFLAEKGLDVPTKELDLYAGEQNRLLGAAKVGLATLAELSETVVPSVSLQA